MIDFLKTDKSKYVLIVVCLIISIALSILYFMTSLAYKKETTLNYNLKKLWTDQLLINNSYENLTKSYASKRWKDVLRYRDEYLGYFEKAKLVEAANPNLYLHSAYAFYSCYKTEKDATLLENARKDIDSYPNTNNGRAIFIKGLINLESANLQTNYEDFAEQVKEAAVFFETAQKNIYFSDIKPSSSEIQNIAYHRALAFFRIGEYQEKIQKNDEAIRSYENCLKIIAENRLSIEKAIKLQSDVKMILNRIKKIKK